MCRGRSGRPFALCNGRFVQPSLNGGAPLGWGAAQGAPSLADGLAGMATDNVERAMAIPTAPNPSAPATNAARLSPSVCHLGLPAMADQGRLVEGCGAFADDHEWCPVSRRFAVLD